MARVVDAGSVAAPVARRRVRAVLAWLHLWVGLSVGLVFAVVGLSGSALVFGDDLLRMAHPSIAAQAVRIDSAVVARVVDAGAAHGLRSLQAPSEAMPTWVGFFEGGRRVHYATDDGRLLLDRSPSNDPLLWLRELHTHLLGGEAGERVLGIVGLVSLGLVLVGVYLWWPSRGRLLSHLRVHAGPPVRRWLTWHRSSGILLLPLLILSIATGVGMVYHEAARSLLTAGFGGAAEVPKPPKRPGGMPDWNRVVETAGHALDGARLTRIAIPKHGDGVVSMRLRARTEWHPNGRSVIALDAGGREVLQRYDATAQPAGSRMADAIYPLHIGAVGGAAVRWLTFVAGLLPAFLLVTGFLFWRRRTAARRGRSAR